MAREGVRKPKFAVSFEGIFSQMQANSNNKIVRGSILRAAADDKILVRLALDEWNGDYKDHYNQHQPYIQYLKQTSRERKHLTSISDALIHLDISTAGQDLRRFNYVCKLLRILLQDKLAFMSGSAQKYVFNILEEMVNHALKSQYNIREMKVLINFTNRALSEHRWSHIGSTHLWNSHYQAVNRMATKLRKFRVKERKADNKVTFSELPHDCILSILSSIPDHADIIHVGQTNKDNYEIANDNLLWKQLCLFHFSNRQILTFVNNNMDESQIDWKSVYRRCYLRYGKKDLYADMLAICCNCNNIFWESIGHPCSSDLSPKSKPITPQEFVNLFHI